MSRQKIFARTAFLLFAALLSQATFAGIVEMKSGEKSLEDVKLASDVTLDSAGKKITLKPFLTGLRKKKIALFWAKVYVGQFFSTPGLTTPPTSIENALNTLASQPVNVITLSFLRDVTASRMHDAFVEALEANQVDVKAESMKPLFTAIEKSGGMKDKETTTIVLERGADGKEMFRFENGKGELQTSTLEAGTIRKILLLWLGKPADSGTERLHEQFLGKED